MRRKSTRIRVLCGAVALVIALMGLSTLSARADGGAKPPCPSDGNGLTMPSLGF